MKTTVKRVSTLVLSLALLGVINSGFAMGTSLTKGVQTLALTEVSGVKDIGVSDKSADKGGVSLAPAVGVEVDGKSPMITPSTPVPSAGSSEITNIPVPDYGSENPITISNPRSPD